MRRATSLETDTSIIQNSPVVSRWVAERLQVDPASFGEHYNFGVVQHGRPLFGAVYTGVRQMPFGKDCTLSVAARDGALWCTHENIRLIFSFGFEHLGCTRISTFVREGHVKSSKLVKHVGFRREGVLRQAHDGRTNAIAFGMLRNECRWLRGE